MRSYRSELKLNQAEWVTDLHNHSPVNSKHLQDNNIKLRNQTHKTGKGRQVRKIRTKEDIATTWLWQRMEKQDIALSSQRQNQAWNNKLFHASHCMSRATATTRRELINGGLHV